MKKFPLLACGITCTLLSSLFCSLTASANSAQAYWEGISATGAVITDENCPIEVEKELLTFDIREFPADYYTDMDAYLAYSGQVSAEYSFYNPADYKVNATLLFPLGNIPSYSHIYNVSEDPDLSRINDHAEKFDIATNGNIIEKKLRHSFSYSYDQFELERDLSRLSDGFMKDDFYTPELPVIQYTYRIDDVDLDAYDAANAAFDVSCDGRSTRIYFPDQSGAHTQKNGALRISAWVNEKGQAMTVYVIGEPLTEPPVWKFYENGGVEDGEEISGTMTLTDTRSLTFQDLALAGWSEKSGVSGTDWYNAVMIMLDTDSYGEDSPVVGTGLYRQDLIPDLMCWYQYEITLEPGEHITNTVTAPIYPSIDARFSPSRYDYTYLLSPASTWAKFGALEIVVNTPYFMTDDSTEGFSKTDTGYSLTLPELPESELFFCLCASEHPEGQSVSHRDYIIRKVIFPAVIAVVILGGCIGFLVLRIKKKNKRRPS